PDHVTQCATAVMPRRNAAEESGQRSQRRHPPGLGPAGSNLCGGPPHSPVGRVGLHFPARPCIIPRLSAIWRHSYSSSRFPMARVCQVSGKRVQTGNNVSHANNKTRRRFLPNLHEHRFWVAGENRYVSLRVSAHALRTIDKNGIDSVLAEL